MLLGKEINGEGVMFLGFIAVKRKEVERIIKDPAKMKEDTNFFCHYPFKKLHFTEVTDKVLSN